MSIVSYAQNFEDVMLWRALKHIDRGFYIDVGAAWPDEHSVTMAFYQRDWRGINIEPNQFFIDKLCDSRPRDTNLRLAVGDCISIKEINLMAETGLSTFDEVLAEKHQAAGWGVSRQAVQVTTLAAIWQDYVPSGQEVHFLKVDVEGFEEAVLKSNDWSKNRPWVVVVEATLPMSQEESYGAWESLLVNASYQFAYADGLNRFYVAREHSGLLPAFKYPPNVFDGFKLAQLHAAEVSAMQAEAQAQRAEVRAMQAEAQAQRAEVLVMQAEAQVQQAMARAKQAETYVSDVLNSASWRVTEPIRWLDRQVGLVSQYGLQSRLRSLVKKILRKVRSEILKRPSLRQQLIGLSDKLGFYDSLRALDRRCAGDEYDASPAVVTMQAKNLSLHGRRIYMQLKAAMELQQKAKD